MRRFPPSKPPPPLLPWPILRQWQPRGNLKWRAEAPPQLRLFCAACQSMKHILSFPRRERCAGANIYSEPRLFLERSSQLRHLQRIRLHDVGNLDARKHRHCFGLELHRMRSREGSCNSSHETCLRALKVLWGMSHASCRLSAGTALRWREILSQL